VLLGLGMPLQEQVLARRRANLPPAVYCAVGGAIEQIAGVQKLAPRWIGRLGLEWAWRLMLHPQRVAYRVFCEPWVLLGLLLRRRLRREP
jgi:N-acetylglucosaminyldiphosphoundecaprenol N-acetyl-beta-D-mannosaminyltransferase